MNINYLDTFFIYLILVFVTTFISLILYLSPKKNSKLKAEQYRSALLGRLFNNSLILTVGSWVTLFTRDFLFIVIALLIGGIDFFRELNLYYFKIRRIINENAEIEETVINNYEYIYTVFVKSKTLLEFSAVLKSRFKFSSEVIFNLYNSFKQSNTESQKTDSKDIVDEAYSILGVRNNASLIEIKKAFREKARILHPDFTRNQDDTKFKELNSAYQLILNRISS
ncbi:MAG: J domain-containing protein [Patescibacteria group bacterium]